MGKHIMDEVQSPFRCWMLEYNGVRARLHMREPVAAPTISSVIPQSCLTALLTLPFRLLSLGVMLMVACFRRPAA